MCKKLFSVVGLAVLLGLCSTPARALQITWEPPVPVTSVDVLNHAGVLVHAGSWGQAGLTQLSVTAGGETIVFNGTSDPGKLVTIKSGGGANADLTVNGQTRGDTFFTGDTGNAAFTEVMRSFGYDGANPKVLTLNGLIVGKTYLIQLFTADDRTASGGRTQLWSDSATRGTGNESATFKHLDNVSIIGRFVADATTIKIYGHGVAQSQTILNGYQLRRPNDLGISQNPAPRNATTDIPRDTVLSWAAGKFAATHDVYLGTSLADVNSASQATPLGTLAGPGLSTATFNPGRLAFSTTYYWRVDEVNTAPDATVRKGDIWSFTTEPVAYPVDGKTITVTASSAADGQPPENTLNGSGLTGDLHGNDLTTMWLTAAGVAGPAWIQYQFPKPVQVHEMWVWNQNGPMEPLLGFGAKDVTIEYSMDGVTFQTLGTQQFARGSGQPDYAHNTVVSFGDVAAKYVKLTINSNWGGLLPQYGLGEVRFFTVPVYVREPNPATGATNVAVDAALGWRAGRDAGQHSVYLGKDPNALSLAGTVTAPSYATSLDVASTYYWRIDEVNASKIPTTWPGDVWKFSTPEYLVVEDFEAYTDDQNAGLAIFQTWKDGSESTTNGATVGNNPAPFAERTIIHGGKQALPLRYDNTSKAFSETTRTFGGAQNWTLHGVQGLTLWFYGDPNSAPQQMYVKINNTKIAYDGDAANLKRTQWQMWYIDLTTLNVSQVTSVSLGLDPINGVGGAGKVLVDDLRLYSYVRPLVTPIAPAATGLQVQYQFEGNADDSSGNGRNGTLKGGVTFADGKMGQALSLDGVDDCVTVAGYKGIVVDATGVQQPFTVCAWIKTATNAMDIIAWGANVNGQRMNFRVDTVLRLENGNGNIRGTNGPSLLDNEWHHVAATLPLAGTLPNTRLYVDGRDVSAPASSTAVFNLTANVDVSIGNGGPMTGRFFKGLIDDARIYDRALSAGEIAGMVGLTVPYDRSF